MQASTSRSMLEAGARLVRERGLKVFYSGLTPSLARGVMYGGLRLGLYEPTREVYAKTFFLQSSEGVVMKVLAGISSGALAAFLLNPTEVVKTRRMQGESWDAIRSAVRLEGIFSLWRGSSMAATRSAILTASQVAVYGEAKRMWLQVVPNAKDDAVAHLGASACAGVLTTAATNPVDVIKTQMFIAKGIEKRVSVMRAVKEIVEEYGVARGATRGFGANYVQLGPQTTVTFVVAEELRKFAGLESLK